MDEQPFYTGIFPFRSPCAAVDVVVPNDGVVCLRVVPGLVFLKNRIYVRKRAWHRKKGRSDLGAKDVAGVPRSVMKSDVTLCAEVLLLAIVLGSVVVSPLPFPMNEVCGNRTTSLPLLSHRFLEVRKQLSQVRSALSALSSFAANPAVVLFGAGLVQSMAAA